jgi:two-component system, sensor histidine kinase and response regulator
MLLVFLYLQKLFWEESWFGLIIALAVILALGLLIVIFIKLLKTIKNKEISEPPKANFDKGQTKQTDNLEAENARLNKLVSEKDNQIKRLQKATLELSKANKELKEQAEKLQETNSEMKKLGEKKQELMKMKDELFGAIVHDLKNPVGLIKGFAELLNSYDLSRQEQESIIQAILETSDKMVTLSQEMTKLIITQSNDVILNMVPIEMNTLISSVIKYIEPAAGKKGIIIEAKLVDNLPPVLADKFRIEEVVDNLISNAIKFTSTNGKIFIENQLDGNNLVLHVRDTGLGLSHEEVNRVFLPLQKLSSKPTGGEPSAGVGLSLTKKIIELHNGKIWVKSKIGEGSTFSFSLPIIDQNKTK